MNNTELIARLVARNIARIEGKMTAGLPLANAIHAARLESVGGPEVWVQVEAHYDAQYRGVDSTAQPL